MKIGIYNECSRGDTQFDGSERYALAITEALAPQHQVEFIHHKPHLNAEHLAKFSGAVLEGVSFRYVAIEPRPTPTQNPLRRYQNEKNWHRNLSESYELFLNIGHDIPPFCHAPNGVLITLFPAFNPTYIWPQPGEKLLDLSQLRKRVERVYHFWEWKQRMDSYRLKLSISHFVQGWVQKRWGAPSEVLYPAFDGVFEERPKENLIINVGRYAVKGVLKRQLEMTQVYAAIHDGQQLPPGWKLLCAGAVGASPEEETYYEKVRALGEAHGAQIEANTPWPQLQNAYERAKIFWHAAGYGAEESHPQEVEHFGIVTLEAMAAGCVPIVINKGGQPEIVQHGINGFVWNTLDELKQYTLLLAQNETLWQQMSQAARQRAQSFNREAFRRRLFEVLKMPAA